MRVNLTLMATAAALAFGLAGAAHAAEENQPGSNVMPSGPTENKGSLSAPEKDTMGTGSAQTGGMGDDSSANVPGVSADGDPKNENQGSLSAPEKDTEGTGPTGPGEGFSHLLTPLAPSSHFSDRCCPRATGSHSGAPL